MIEKISQHGAVLVGFVTLAAVLVALLATAPARSSQPLAMALGMLILFLGYFVSDGWTPVDEWNPAVFWSASIACTAVVEILLAYLL